MPEVPHHWQAMDRGAERMGEFPACDVSGCEKEGGSAATYAMSGVVTTFLQCNEAYRLGIVCLRRGCIGCSAKMYPWGERFGCQ